MKKTSYFCGAGVSNPGLHILANSLLPRHIPSSETKGNLDKSSMNEIAKLAT